MAWQSKRNGVEEPQEQKKGDPPVWQRKIARKSSCVEVALFEFHQENNGKAYINTMVSLKRRYYNPESKQWQDAKGFQAEDIPDVILLLQQAHAAFMEAKERE